MSEPKKIKGIKPNKHCIVPNCGNSLRDNPEKKFFELPADSKRREAWLCAVHITKMQIKRGKHVCEDHFTLEEDLCKKGKATVMFRLKPEVVPHKNISIAPKIKKVDNNQEDLTINKSASPLCRNVCPHCPYYRVKVIFVTALITHVYERHTTNHKVKDKRIFYCPFCTWKSTTEEMYMEHLVIHNEHTFLLSGQNSYIKKYHRSHMLDIYFKKIGDTCKLKLPAPRTYSKKTKPVTSYPEVKIENVDNVSVTSTNSANPDNGNDGDSWNLVVMNASENESTVVKNESVEEENVEINSMDFYFANSKELF